MNQIEKIKARFVDPDESLNLTIPQAMEMAQMMAEFGMPYGTIAAVQPNPAGPESQDVVDIATLQAIKFPNDVPLYFVGYRPNSPDQKYDTIANDAKLIAGKDGANSFAELYADRNPGGTTAAAFAAAWSVPAAQHAAAAALDTIRSEVKI